MAWTEAHLDAKCHLDPSNRLATIDMVRKLGGGYAPFGRKARSPSNTMWPGPRPTCTPSFILIHPNVWPQYTNVTERTDRQTGQDNTDRQQSDSIVRTVLQTVAQKLKLKFLLLSIWTVTELYQSAMCIPLTLFDALACTCFLHLHSAALVSNY